MAGTGLVNFQILPRNDTWEKIFDAIDSNNQLINDYLVHASERTKIKSFIATADQVDFELDDGEFFITNTNSLAVYVNDIRIWLDENSVDTAEGKFAETSDHSFKLGTPATEGDLVIAVYYAYYSVERPNLDIGNIVTSAITDHNRDTNAHYNIISRMPFLASANVFTEVNKTKKPNLDANNTEIPTVSWVMDLVATLRSTILNSESNFNGYKSMGTYLVNSSIAFVASRNQPVGAHPVGILRVWVAGSLTGDRVIVQEYLPNATGASPWFRTCRYNPTGGVEAWQAWFNAANLVYQNVRTRLSADRTYYLRKEGADTNNGLSSSTAFLTFGGLLAAIDRIDGSSYDVTIDLGVGVWSDPAFIGADAIIQFKSFLGIKTLTIRGQGASTILDGSGNLNAFHDGVIRNSDIRIGNLKFQNCKNGLLAESAQVTINQNILIGECVESQFKSTRNGNIIIAANCEVLDGAETFMEAIEGSRIRLENGWGITFSNIPNYTNATIQASLLGIVNLNGALVGTATGKRYLVTKNAIIDTDNSGEAFIPGDSQGESNTGGLYV